jgi:hypothetical protein
LDGATETLGTSEGTSDGDRLGVVLRVVLGVAEQKKLYRLTEECECVSTVQKGGMPKPKATDIYYLVVDTHIQQYRTNNATIE